MHIRSLAFSVSLLLMATLAYAGERLYVFFPTVMRPQVLQNKLTESCPNVEILVFGRYHDFLDQIQTAPPDAIITKPQLLNQLNGYTVKLAGISKGTTEESYVLVSLDSSATIQSLKNKTIGAVDFLGREQMQPFIADFLGPSVKIKTVPKVEDLLPLLTFGMSDALLVPQRLVEYFRTISNRPFIIIPILNTRGGIVVLATRKENKSSVIVTAIKQIPGELYTVLGVEQWK